MKIKFDSHQNYQLEAIRSVVELFEGQPTSDGDFWDANGSVACSDKGISNKLTICEEDFLANLKRVQQYNDVPLSDKLEKCLNVPYNFTIEMETGTGKTYTYLRTIFELNKVYGFCKFVIVVPSVAIREGVVKSLQMTQSHFAELYPSQPFNYRMYDSASLTDLRDFAISSAVQILVINIDSFAKQDNIINTVRENGKAPIEYIRATNPIVILDEPQNMETDIRKSAIGNLNPLCTLRYSATHRNQYNLVYNLNPVRAYDMGLVKHIEVDGVTADENYNQAFVHLKEFVQGKKELRAKLGIYVEGDTGAILKYFTVGVGDDLYKLSNNRELYKQGYTLYSINVEKRYVEFSSGYKLKLGETIGGLTDDILKYQIERTIFAHFEKLKKTKTMGVKVLSLFFIDRVSNYREYGQTGGHTKGKFAIWFEELFRKYATMPENIGLVPFEAEQVHNGYFSQKNKGDGGCWMDTAGNTQKDNDTYSLIMRDKERLLSVDEPLQFIFSHSALREGWDNPNVFQICTLGETRNTMKKRQEIGRGLRLPVDSTGARIKNDEINVLTVIANETYEDFAKTLQKEIQDETSVDFKGRIRNMKTKTFDNTDNADTLDSFETFYGVWNKINESPRYNIRFQTEDLIDDVLSQLADHAKYPLSKKRQLSIRSARLNYTEKGIDSIETMGQVQETAPVEHYIPNVYEYIQARVCVTRKTIFEILKRSGRYHELEVNPIYFLDLVVSAIRQSYNNILGYGVKYELIADRVYEQTLLDCSDRVSSGQTLNLPKGIKVITPLGDYVPKKAILSPNGQSVYFLK